MATYVEITNAQIDVDSPITTGLMTQYRDNLTAVIEADPSAPKVIIDALDSDTATPGLPLVSTASGGVELGAQVATDAEYRGNSAGSVGGGGGTVAFLTVNGENNFPVVSSGSEWEYDGVHTGGAIIIANISGEMIASSGTVSLEIDTGSGFINYRTLDVSAAGSFSFNLSVTGVPGDVFRWVSVGAVTNCSMTLFSVGAA